MKCTSALVVLVVIHMVLDLRVAHGARPLRGINASNGLVDSMRFYAIPLLASSIHLGSPGVCQYARVHHDVF